MAVFEFGDDVVFTYRGSWCADGLRTSWESAWRIVGERGSLIWDGYDDLTAEVASASAGEGLFRHASAVAVPPLDPRDRIGGHLGVMQDFVAAVRERLRAGNGGARQHQEPGDGLRRDRQAPKPAAASKSPMQRRRRRSMIQ